VNTITQIDIPGVKKLKSGKVREVFDLGDSLLFVATDRISAFDVILPNPIPEKGRVLTALSEFWFRQTAHIAGNHFITSDLDIVAQALALSLPNGSRLRPFVDELRGRSMLVRKCRPLPIECVVRGYLAGSGLKEYKQSRTVCGIRLPEGLVESNQLPQPIFTPATKAETGHDENIDFDRCATIVGQPLAEQKRHVSLALYSFARDYAAQRGIIIADTKFEFGLPSDVILSEAKDLGSLPPLLLIDEALTPDSSRFWPADSYAPGKPQPSFDKQFVRDYLETLDWNKTPPGPTLPDAVIRKTSEKYLEALTRLTA
jgi:phosphoribosylaminoimidazole-succinocarboxamide synthase